MEVNFRPLRGYVRCGFVIVKWRGPSHQGPTCLGNLINHRPPPRKFKNKATSKTAKGILTSATSGCSETYGRHRLSFDRTSRRCFINPQPRSHTIIFPLTINLSRKPFWVELLLLRCTRPRGRMISWKGTLVLSMSFFSLPSTTRCYFGAIVEDSVFLLCSKPRISASK